MRALYEWTSAVQRKNMNFTIEKKKRFKIDTELTLKRMEVIKDIYNGKNVFIERSKKLADKLDMMQGKLNLGKTLKTVMLLK